MLNLLLQKRVFLVRFKKVPGNASRPAFLIGEWCLPAFKCKKPFFGKETRAKRYQQSLK